MGFLGGIEAVPEFPAEVRLVTNTVESLNARFRRPPSRPLSPTGGDQGALPGHHPPAASEPRERDRANGRVEGHAQRPGIVRRREIVLN